MVGVTVPVLVVEGGQAPPDTSSSEPSLSASDVEILGAWFRAPSLLLSRDSACAVEFVSCPLVIFNSFINADRVNPTLKRYAGLIS
jgi:hypothetical protein